jgi:hypothetical protein
MQFIRVSFLACALAATGLLVACGKDGSDANGAVSSTPSTTTKLEADTASAAAEATKGMVAGVTNPAKPGAPVELKFELKDRPQAGLPLPIELAFIPLQDTDYLRATFIATDGLTVQLSPNTPEYRDVDAGRVYRYTLTVVPRDDGVYYASVIVVMDLPNGAEARSFSIPVIVGAPSDDDPVSKPQPPKDATGQSIESMPAQ